MERLSPPPVPAESGGLLVLDVGEKKRPLPGRVAAAVAGVRLLELARWSRECMDPAPAA